VIRRISLLLAALAVLATGCDGATPSATTPSSSTTHPALVRATEPPLPEDGRCYQLSYQDAVAPTSDASHVSCRKPHTAHTFHVGTIDAVVDGHLLAVDARRVQEAIARKCTRRLSDYLGGSADDLALSMFRAVWFSPSVEQSDAGENWFRCDVIALAREDELATLPRHPSLDDESFGTCGTAEPGSSGFERVICSAEHSWRAIAVVRHHGTTYPGGHELIDDQAACEDPARAAAKDPLSVVFSYLAPTRAQWNAGQHYGTCWVPTD
jgi:hypothetical protein